MAKRINADSLAATCGVALISSASSSSSSYHADDAPGPHSSPHVPSASASRSPLLSSTLSLLSLSFPSVLTNLLFVSQGFASQIIVGRISTDALQVCVVANMTFNIFWYGIYGFAGALDSLGSQSFGASNYSGLRQWSIRTAVMVTILTLIASIPLYFSYSILTTILSQPSHIASQGETFIRWMLLGLLPFNLCCVMQKHMQVQSIMYPCVWIAIVANVANVAIEILLIHNAGCGLQGGAIGVTIARWIQFVIMLSYVIHVDRKEQIKRLNHIRIEANDDEDDAIADNNGSTQLVASPSSIVAVRCRPSSPPTSALLPLFDFASMCHLLSLGLSSSLMCGLEAWSFDCIGIMATRLSSVDLAAHYVMINITLFGYFTFPYGVSIAASIIVGHAVGRGDVDEGKRTAKVAVAAGVMFMSLTGVTYYCTRTVIGGMFSSDALVISAAASIAPIGAAFQIFDGVQGTAAGVLRGVGLQNRAAVGYAAGMIAVGIAAAYTLAFEANMGLTGLWWGIAIGIATTAAINVTMCITADWDKQVMIAREWNNKSENIDDNQYHRHDHNHEGHDDNDKRTGIDIGEHRDRMEG